MDFNFITKDHPEANGRQPLDGEQGWNLSFPLEVEGDKLIIRMGKTSRRALRFMLTQEDADDAAELKKLSEGEANDPHTGR